MQAADVLQNMQLQDKKETAYCASTLQPDLALLTWTLNVPIVESN